MNNSKRKTNVTEAIREIPAMYLMELKYSTLNKLEKKIKQEIDQLVEQLGVEQTLYNLIFK